MSERSMCPMRYIVHDHEGFCGLEDPGGLFSWASDVPARPSAGSRLMTTGAGVRHGAGDAPARRWLCINVVDFPIVVDWPLKTRVSPPQRGNPPRCSRFS